MTIKEANELKRQKDFFSKCDDDASIERESIVVELAKARLEKLGCGVYLRPVGSYKSCGKRTPLSLNDDGINWCDECKAKGVEKEKEIYEEILK